MPPPSAQVESAPLLVDLEQAPDLSGSLLGPKARNLGLLAVELVPAIKHHLALRFMGLSGGKSMPRPQIS